MTAETLATDDPGSTGSHALRGAFIDLAGGELEALDAIYDVAADRLFALALWRTGSPVDAEDVVQDVFVRLARQGEKLGRIRDPQAFLAVLAHRAAIDLVRRRRAGHDPVESCPYLTAPAATPERQLDAERVSARLAELPPAQREAIYLHHFAELSFAAIGRATGVPTFTAASRYRLGLKRLRRLLGLS